MPDGAPVGFVLSRWAGYLAPVARRFADPSSFLLTPQRWEPIRLEYCQVVGKPASAADAMAMAEDELHAR